MTIKTTYDPRITPEFVMECAKVGAVSVFSSQVTIRDRREIRMRDVAIPQCFAIEWIGHDDSGVQITLKLKETP